MDEQEQEQEPTETKEELEARWDREEVAAKELGQKVREVLAGQPEKIAAAALYGELINLGPHAMRVTLRCLLGDVVGL